MNVRLDLFDNSWYKPGGIIKRTLWFILGNIFINSYLPIPMTLKIMLLKAFGAKIGVGVVIKPKVNIKYPWFLEVQDYVWIGEAVWIDNFVKVTLKSHSCISQGAMLLTGNHDWSKAEFDLIPKPIIIGNGAWVGAQTVVCPGIDLGDYSVLTVGSIATKNLDAQGVYQGNPAIFIKNRPFTQ